MFVFLVYGIHDFKYLATDELVVAIDYILDLSHVAVFVGSVEDVGD